MDQYTDSTEQRLAEQEALRRTFVQIPMEIFYDSRLTPNDKIIYGRISTFDEFFESRTRTAELLNVSTKQIQRSITKLLELGYIRFIQNDGRGNRYAATEQPLRALRMAKARKIHDCPGVPLTDEEWLDRLDKFDRAGTNCPEKRTNCPHDRTKCPTEYKERIKKEENSLKEEKEQKTFGNPQVNELMADWTDATGFDHSKIKSERYAMAGLIKQHGYEATKALVKRVKAATRSGDPFAPQIAKASQLRGKYSKLEALVQWERRAQAKAAAEEAKKPAAVPVGLYPEFKPDPYDDIPDTPEARAQRHATAQALREKYGFGRRAD